MNLSFHPGYSFKGKTYKTVNGLLSALHRDSSAPHLSMVIDNSIRAFAEDRKTILVTYDITPPVAGKQQRVTRVREITGDLVAAAVASAYNTDPVRKAGDAPLTPARATAWNVPAVKAALVRAYASRIQDDAPFNRTELVRIVARLQGA